MGNRPRRWRGATGFTAVCCSGGGVAMARRRTPTPGLFRCVVEAPEPASEAAPGRMEIVLGEEVRVIVDATVHAPALARVVAVVGRR